jgi:hypothetical protein
MYAKTYMEPKRNESARMRSGLPATRPVGMSPSGDMEMLKYEFVYALAVPVISAGIVAAILVIAAG